MLNRFIGFTFAIVLSAGAFSQADVSQAPPPVQFGDWSQVSVQEDFVEYRFAFTSAYESLYPENNTVPVVVFLPAQRQNPVPAVLVLHYLGASDLKVERALGIDLAKRGMGAVLVTLPYHIERTPKGHRSGELAITGPPADLIKTMVQSIWDVRRTIDFVQSRPEFLPNQLGIAGTSLGSIVASLAYAIDARLDRSALVLAGADVAHILWHSSLVVKQREELRKQGYTEPRLREELKSIEPLNYLPSRSQPDVYIVGAKFDTIIPAADTQKLINAIPGAKTLWLDTGHYGGIFVQRRVQRSVADYFEARANGKEFDPPKRIYAPTLRIGVLGSSNRGLQVGVGIDVFQFDRQGRFLSTLYATPKGLELFLGAKLDKNIYIGGFGSQKGVGFGANWSTVL